MKLFFVIIVAIVFCSCSSAVKDEGTAKAINSGDPVNAVPKSTADTAAKWEHQNVISQEHILSVDVEDRNISVKVTNVFPEELFYGAKFIFERFQNGKWQKVEYVRNYGIPSIEYILKPGETRTHAFSFKVFNKALSEGKYRVIKEYNFNDKVSRKGIREFRIGKDDAASAGNNPAPQNAQPQTTGKDLSEENLLSFKVENRSITLTLTNVHDQPIFYDSQIAFEKWNGSKWEKIDFTDIYIFVSMEYVLLPGAERTHPFPFTSFADQTACGRYRVIKGYYFADKLRREAVKEFDIQAAGTLCLEFPAIVKRADLMAQKSLFYSVINFTNNTYITGDRFFLERRKKDGQWEKVKLEAGLVNDIGYKISPQTESSHIEMQTYLLRNLPADNYRITKSAFEYPGKKEITLQAEFKVTE